MADKKAVTLEQLEIAKNYIDRKDAENIKSADFVDNTIKFYASEDKSGEAIAELVLPEEMFLDGSKTEFVSDFTWDITKYPKSTDPELDGKPVLVLAVKSVRTVRYSFISLDSVIAKLIGVDTESASASIVEDVISLNVKVSELSGNRIVIKNDGLYVGAVDNTPSWAVSTDDEVREMFAVSGGGITLASMSIGDTVKIMENGEPVDFLIVHKGLPSDMYDESCDGVWLLREKSHSDRAWHGTSSATSLNDYEKSDINAWLNGEFYNCVDENIRGTIKQVKIPYRKGSSGSSIRSGANGLSTKIFLLSGYEVGHTKSDNSGLFVDGACLKYFTTDVTKRVCKDSSNSAVSWWVRTADSYTTDYASVVSGVGGSYGEITFHTNDVRPAFILPYDITVDSNGFVIA